MSFFRSVPTEPPPSRVPAVLQRRAIIERELIDFRLQIDERVLACVEGKPDARSNLAALHENIRVAEFELEGLPAARDLAANLDETARAAWMAEVQTLSPREIVDGLSKYECCNRCTSGCVILGADGSAHQNDCGHPLLVGALAARYADNPQIQAVYAAAIAKLGIWPAEVANDGEAA